MQQHNNQKAVTWNWVALFHRQFTLGASQFLFLHPRFLSSCLSSTSCRLESIESFERTFVHAL